MLVAAWLSANVVGYVSEVAQCLAWFLLGWATHDHIWVKLPVQEGLSPL